MRLRRPSEAPARPALATDFQGIRCHHQRVNAHAVPLPILDLDPIRTDERPVKIVFHSPLTGPVSDVLVPECGTILEEFDASPAERHPVRGGIGLFLSPCAKEHRSVRASGGLSVPQPRMTTAPMMIASPRAITPPPSRCGPLNGRAHVSSRALQALQRRLEQLPDLPVAGLPGRLSVSPPPLRPALLRARHVLPALEPDSARLTLPRAYYSAVPCRLNGSRRALEHRLVHGKGR